MQDVNDVMITAITYGCTDLLKDAHVSMIAACRKLMKDAIFAAAMNLGNNPEGKVTMREVHHSMIAMAEGDVSFQIANGDRMLMFTGGDHCLTTFMYCFPGASELKWTMGQ